ncbi:hypothetical protein K3172_14135 [Qipengyuania sp. 6B39]|uniref:hypothetical protein n=1 Tax=Qipengyuania proteolytica TaxID=2867239 RepID=UPI001C8ACD59|nr:hypothetical protein [Qipengyuania proteolytica]MBX7496997.1 hypothetical protein [Qipengyuania proteolytica]
MTDVLWMFHRVRMGRFRLDTVHDFARRGYNLRVECRRCQRVMLANAVLLQIELGAARSKWPIERVQACLKCRGCGHRGALVTACRITCRSNFCPTSNT